METITKQQLILVCLLVAIVTSVATSVVTVSLSDGSVRPDLTIYKVIERTIEKVTDNPTVKNIVGTNDTPKPAPQTEISPSDIVEKKSKSVLRIYEKIGEVKTFVALGVAIGGKNGVLTSTLQNSYVQPATRYVAITEEGKEIPVKYEKGGVAGTFNFFTLQYDGTETSKVTPLPIKGIAGLKLGSNIVALGGKENGDVLSTGIITELRAENVNASTTKNLLFTDMNLTTSISGWLLFDTAGNLVAFERGFEEPGHSPVFINAKVVEEDIKEFL